MNKEYETTLSNGLRASIDWIAFTTRKLSSVEEVIRFMGYDTSDFTELAKGGMGYKSMKKLNGYPVTILYNGKEDMGIHVNITGSAVPEVVRSYKDTLASNTPFGIGYDIPLDSTALIQFLTDISNIGHFSRLDIAIDDIGYNYFSPSDILELKNSQRIVSKFRTINNYEGSLLSGEKRGHTVYLGSRHSDIFIRIYDKKLEQNAKHPDTPVLHEWIRWEFQLSNERAMKAVTLLISLKNIGDVCMGLFRNYLRIIQRDNNHKSRCSEDPLWIQFVTQVESLSLYVPKESKTLAAKEEWLKKQCMPTLAGYIVANHGDMGILCDNFDSYLARMSKDMRDLVERENPEWNDN